MLFMQGLILTMVAGVGAAVVLTRDPLKQALAISLYGILLSLLFFLLQAPDVSLSQIVVGAVALPLMILLAIVKVQKDAEERRRKERTGRGR
jgi:energy-converting hydrogenase B subunit D